LRAFEHRGTEVGGDEPSGSVESLTQAASQHARAARDLQNIPRGFAGRRCARSAAKASNHAGPRQPS
jgi:hypothetical protein